MEQQRIVETLLCDRRDRGKQINNIKPEKTAVVQRTSKEKKNEYHIEIRKILLS